MQVRGYKIDPFCLCRSIIQTSFKNRKSIGKGVETIFLQLDPLFSKKIRDGNKCAPSGFAWFENPLVCHY